MKPYHYDHLNLPIGYTTPRALDLRMCVPTHFRLWSPAAVLPEAYGIISVEQQKG